MFKKDAVFNAAACVTPDFAAKLANTAGQFKADVYLECNNVRLCVDSLISILAMDLRKGGSVAVFADGADEQDAVAAVCAALMGEN